MKRESNMAEGGYDPETTNPFDPHGDNDDDDKTPLIPHREEGEGIGMKHREFSKFPPARTKTSTSTSGEHETSFIDAHSEEVLTSNVELQKEEIERKIKGIFYKPTTSLFFSRIDEYHRVMVKLRRINAREYELLNGSGELAINLEKLPKGLRGALGKTHEEVNQEIYEKQLKEEQKQEERQKKHEEARRKEEENEEKYKDAKQRIINLQDVLREQKKAKKNAESPEEKKEHDKNINRTQRSIKEVEEETIELMGNRNRLERATLDAGAQVNEEERMVETARERVDQRLLSLKQRIKEIFKKYGFTAIAVATAIATVIGVIVSNLKAGLTKVAKGVGNGLKELGKKLGEILPGMIGAIASFIFRTAGEVIGFLAKNAWLLVVGLVLLAVEQLKKKSR